MTCQGKKRDCVSTGQKIKRLIHCTSLGFMYFLLILFFLSRNTFGKLKSLPVGALSHSSQLCGALWGAGTAAVPSWGRWAEEVFLKGISPHPIIASSISPTWPLVGAALAQSSSCIPKSITNHRWSPSIRGGLGSKALWVLSLAEPSSSTLSTALYP